MDVLVMAGQLILGLSILVILHELGHFLAARAFGIKVEKFYLFFDAWNVSLFKYNYKGVEYGIGWLPLGGYVKIAGMIDESMDTEQMAAEPQPWEFRSKPAWQRLIVMLGGVTVNIILGILIFWILTLKYGESYIPNNELKHGIVPGTIGQKIGLRAGDQIVAIDGKPLLRYEDIVSSQVLMGNSILTVERNGKILNITVPSSIVNDISDQGIDQFVSRLPRIRFAVDSLQPGSGAQKAGLLKGDSIVSVNGKPVVYFDEMQKALVANKGKQVQLGVKRNQQLLQINAQLNAQGQLGFYQKDDLPKEKTVQYGFFQSLPVGAAKAWDTFSANAVGIGKMISGKINPSKAISSPLRIATFFGSTVDWLRFWSLVGLLSMALALMNLLPIPALDGGHALFLIIEMIKGKPLSDKFLERAQIAGFVVLITLMVFAFGNDILRIVHHK